MPNLKIANSAPIGHRQPLPRPETPQRGNARPESRAASRRCNRKIKEETRNANSIQNPLVMRESDKTNRNIVRKMSSITRSGETNGAATRGRRREARERRRRRRNSGKLPRLNREGGREYAAV